MDIEPLNEHVAEGRSLLRVSSDQMAHARFNNWVDSVAEWITETLRDPAIHAEWSSLGHSPLKWGLTPRVDPAAWDSFRSTVESRLAWLARLARTLALPPGTPSTTTTPSDKVFIVHGRNEAPKEAVARFLEKLDLHPLILHEQPNRGRTLIEKFIDYSDVSFAVVILTGDDIGQFAESREEQPTLRPRQNVLLELGFFLGRLGRERVCALHEEGAEIPSDYDGVVYIPLDTPGAWRMLLARELKAAGLPFDMNKAV